MNSREKKAAKLLMVLVPVFALTIGYAYFAVQDVKAKQAEKHKQSNTAEIAPAQEQPAPAPVTAADTKQGTKAGKDEASTHPALNVHADFVAQKKRESLAWGRDPFIPPDKQGPVIVTPADAKSPRTSDVVSVKAMISDAATGNSGVRAATLFVSETGSNAQKQIAGTPPANEFGYGEWSFTVPAPSNKPLACHIVANDAGKLNNVSRSADFKIEPPSRETLQAQVAGTDVMLTLRGISWAGDTGMAIINRDVVSQGESVHGFKVIRVNKDSVQLQRDGEEVVLRLKE